MQMAQRQFGLKTNSDRKPDSDQRQITFSAPRNHEFSESEDYFTKSPIPFPNQPKKIIRNCFDLTTKTWKRWKNAFENVQGKRLWFHQNSKKLLFLLFFLSFFSFWNFGLQKLQFLLKSSLNLNHYTTILHCLTRSVLQF